MKIYLLFFVLFLGSLNAVSLTKDGELTWVLDGDSSATLPDPVIVSEGILEVSAGNNLGSNTGSLSLGTATLHITGASFSTARTTTLTGDATVDIDSGTATFSGVLQGAGSLTKSNTAATLALSANNTYGGSTTVSGGTLHLTNSLAALASPAVTVDAGATFLGTGTVGTGAPDTFQNFGKVTPEGATGTLHIQANCTQETGSTLEIELNPSSAAILDVTGGFMTIASGATISFIPDPAEYPSLTPLLIISGPGTGTFDTVEFSLPAFGGSLVYVPLPSLGSPSNDDWLNVFLLINTVPFTTLFPEGNVGAVARCLDGINPTEGTDIDSVITQLQFMSLSQMEETMNQMQPSLFNALDLAEEETMIEMREAISRRLADFQRKKCADCKKEELWGGFLYSRSRQDSKGSKVGFQTRTQSGVSGLDYHLPGKPALLGVSFGYARDDLTWRQSTGNSAINSYCGSLYLAGKIPSAYLRFVAMASYCDSHGKRRIVFPTTLASQSSTRIARHGIKGWGLLAHGEGGFMLSKGTVEVHPFGSGDYVFVHRLPFRETGANSLNLNVQAHDADLLRSEVGLKFLKCSQGKSDSRWFPHAKVSWIFEKRLTGKNSKASFTVSDCVMTVKGLSPTRNLFAYSFGLDVRGWSDHFFLGTEFEGEWSKNYRSYNFEAQVKLGF